MKAILLLLLVTAAISTQVNTDWIKCAEESLQLVSDIDQLVKDAVTKDVQIIIRDLKVILEDIERIKQYCGLSLPELKLEISENTDWIKCAKDAAKIAELVVKLQKDAATMNIPAVINDLKEMIDKINDLKKDCGLSIDLPILELANTDWIKCAKDAAKIAELVVKLQKDAATLNVPAVINDLKEMLEKINDLKKDCGISIDVPVLLLNDQDNDWIKCAEEVLQLVADIDQLVKDAVVMDVTKIVKDLEVILEDISTVKKTCGLGMPDLRMDLSANTDWIKCAKDAAKIAELVVKLQKDAATLNVPAVINDLKEMLEKINDLKKDCGISVEYQDMNEINTDWIKCAKDAAKIAELVVKLQKDAATLNVPAVINDLKEMLEKINDLKKDCGISTEQLIQNLPQEMSSWIQCGKDAMMIIGDVEQLVLDAEKLDITKVIQDLQRILSDINKLKTDCGLKMEFEVEYKNTDWIQCAKDGIQIVADVEKLVKDAGSMEIAKIIQDLQVILGDIVTLKKDCGIKTDLMSELKAEWIKCAKDGIKLVENVKRLVEDSISKDFSKIIEDLQTIMTDINLIKIDCGIEINLEYDMEGNWQKCMQDSMKIYKLVQELVQDAASQDIPKVMEDLRQILLELNALKTDCKIVANFEYLQFQNTDWIKCGKDALEIYKLIQQLVADAKEMKIQAVMQDLAQISQEIQTMKADCGLAEILAQPVMLAVN